jgi:hypothetical protein
MKSYGKCNMPMKRFQIVTLLILLLLVSCTREMPVPVANEEPFITFNITPVLSDGEPEVRAVKTGWENGDAIFLFFDGVASPQYLKMVYDGTQWSYTSMNGSSAGSWTLPSSEGGFAAIYLPFGSSATLKKGDTAETEEIFYFSTTYRAYYLAGGNTYHYDNDVVTASVSLSVPANFVQFFVKADSPVSGAYKLGTDAVKPVELLGICPDKTDPGRYGGCFAVIENRESAGVYMPGFAYKGGYLFSGLMNTGYAYGNSFYFSLSNSAGTSRSDLFVTGKTLSSHSAVQLPDLGDSRWLPVGSGLTVSLGTKHGVWYTCNYGASKPEELGTLVTQTAAKAAAKSPALLLSKTRLDALVANNPAVTWTPMSVHGKPGVVAQCSGGFLFLPTYYVAGTTPVTYPAKDMDYWCEDDTNANVLHITASGIVSAGKQDTGNTHYVRFVK